jgi:hypothetical protein
MKITFVWVLALCGLIEVNRRFITASIIRAIAVMMEAANSSEM